MTEPNGRRPINAFTQEPKEPGLIAYGCAGFFLLLIVVILTLVAIATIKGLITLIGAL